MTFKIFNGTTWVDITPYIALGGLKWQRADVDGANTGRTQAGNMVRDRVAIKYRFDITCRPLRAAELATVLQLIEPVFVYVQYTDPTTNTVKSAEFYSNNIPASYAFAKKHGATTEEWWQGVTFPLIQK